MRKLFYLFVLITIVSCSASRPTQQKIKKPVQVKLTTDSGVIVLRLYDKTPLHKNNFIKLVKEKFYDGLLFHRVINNFMIQGGDPDSKNAKPGIQLGEGTLKYTVPAEFDTSLFHKRGALAAAREGDENNPKKASSSTQFYIVDGQTYTDSQFDMIEKKYHVNIPPNHREFYKTIGGDPFLDMNYTVFGEVVSGMDVVEKIANAPKDDNNRPLHNIKMKMELLR
ncbi:MAG: peptidylprolyl isomerase [Bacteroidota bacterium]|nr:peptidylprolyl isomerase [Bacteroidota bacterium]